VVEPPKLIRHLLPLKRKPHFKTHKGIEPRITETATKTAIAK
jgi:hypothetical protein